MQKSTEMQIIKITIQKKLSSIQEDTKLRKQAWEDEKNQEPRIKKNLFR